MPKSKSTKKSKIRHQPLGQVITEDLKSSKYAKTKIKSSQPSSGNESDDDNDDDGYMDEKTSARIYNMSREQQEEEEARAGNKGREAVFEDVEGKELRRPSGDHLDICWRPAGELFVVRRRLAEHLVETLLLLF